MIDNIKKLKDCIKKDRIFNERESIKNNIKDDILYEHLSPIWKYIKLLRIDEYFSNSQNKLLKIFKIYYRRKRNKLGVKLGLTIPINVFDEGLRIWHYGNIVINGHARVGKNCVLHGDNCIGNNSFSIKAPKIGNNVDIGVGAKIIGDIEIADDIVIGANSVVTKSFLEKGIVIAGVPAVKIKERKDIRWN